MPLPDFSFQYMPSPTTLFRFSALTFNGHYIHLDKDYARSEGYSGTPLASQALDRLTNCPLPCVERLVHGPLTALMLLDTAVHHHPELKLKTFEYRALNPLVVNKAITVHGAWEKTVTADSSEKALLVWAIDDQDVVGMSGRITV